VKTTFDIFRSAYTIFFRETQQKVKEQNPTAKFGDISRSVAAMWEGLSEAEKAVFKKKSDEDRAR
jgi:HMG (high mobility group) box